MNLSLILASQSPRRKELLTQLGYMFTCIPADINEDVIDNESPLAYVSRLAVEKAQAASRNLQREDILSSVVLGSDTSVVYQDEILGKPEDLNDSIRQLQLLSGNTHQVLTSISAVLADTCITKVVTTDVTFKTLTLLEIERYWATGEPQDKAGSYGIQGIGGQFVSHISGSYSAVVGLPLYETSQLLAKFGLATAVQQLNKDTS